MEPTQEQKTNWRIQTDFLILETERIDNDFRIKYQGHNRICKTIKSPNSKRWFCKCLLRNRKRNVLLRQKWELNLLDSPYIKR